MAASHGILDTFFQCCNNIIIVFSIVVHFLHSIISTSINRIWIVSFPFCIISSNSKFPIPKPLLLKTIDFVMEDIVWCPSGH